MLTEAGYSAVVSTSVGDKLAQGDCTVIRQETTSAAPFVGGDVNAPATKPKVMLSLSCNPQSK
jgi:hypothetical protein